MTVAPAPLRVGAVNYLNTKPLIRHLPELVADFDPPIDLILDVPSQLAMDLHEGRADVALIPSIEYFRMPGRYTILPGHSISSFGPVMSVKICSGVPFERIERLDADEGSRTSVALAEILLDRLFGLRPQVTPLPLHKTAQQSNADAVLVIGDRAMRVPDGAYPYTLDLGYEWSRWTGLPFVFAFWAVAEGVTVPQSLLDALDESAARGRADIPAIAAAEARALGLNETQCRYYLEHVIRHGLGQGELASLERFRDLAVQRGIAPEGANLEFHRSESPRTTGHGTTGHGTTGHGTTGHGTTGHGTTGHGTTGHGTTGRGVDLVESR